MSKEGSTASERRTSRRRPVIWRGTLSVGSFRFECRINDISLTGARLRLDLPLKRGAEVMLTTPHGESLPAVVAYHKDQTLAVSFTVTPEEMCHRLGERASHILGLDAELVEG
ncbi:MAG: PilZ domain-containing protein [Rhodothalassiaceae bacterium]